MSDVQVTKGSSIPAIPLVNAPTVMKMAQEGRTFEEIESFISIANRYVVTNALKMAKREIAVNAIPALTKVLSDIGGPYSIDKEIKPGKEAQEKVYDFLVDVKCTAKAHEDIKSLIHGWLGRSGKVLSMSADRNTAQYGMTAKMTDVIKKKLGIPFPEISVKVQANRPR